MSNYPNLPGVNVSIKDGQLHEGNPTSANSILIIAPVKAPTSIVVPEEPVYIGSEQDLRSTFGANFFKGEMNPIAAQWKVAKNNGFNSIYLLALKGATAKEKFLFLQEQMFGVLQELNVAHIVLDGVTHGEKVDGILTSDLLKLDGAEMSGLKNVYKYQGTAVTLPLTTAKTITITQDEVSVVITAPKTVSDMPTFLSALNKEIRNAFEEKGLNFEVIATEVTGKKLLLTTDRHVTVTSDVELGLNGVVEESKIEADFSSLLADYAEFQNAQTGNLIAYIAAKRPASTSLADIKKNIEELVKIAPQYSKYLQVIVGPEVSIELQGNLRSQWVSGVTQYAATVNSLPPQIATTNKALAGAFTLRYNLSLRQMNQLVGANYVVFKMKNNQVTVVDGVTSARDLRIGNEFVPSDFKRLSTLRTTNFMVDEIRNACDVFIGQTNEFHVYTAMNTAIKSVVKNAIDQGVIQDAKYSIKLGQKLDSSIVNLTILPQFELKTIDVEIGLSTPNNF